MVPSAFILLDALPFTPSGKVDRRALPAPDDFRSSFGDGFIPPRTPAEQSVAAIWCEVLDIKQVGVHDNFFRDLGGHSLLATQLISRMRDAFRVELPLRRLFETPVGFKWFVDGLLTGSIGFGGEESAGASFLRRDGGVWSGG